MPETSPGNTGQTAQDEEGAGCKAAGAPEFFLANGFSGHGVVHAPATGKDSVGPHCLRPMRFIKSR